MIESLKQNDRESHKLLKLMRKLADETKKLISDVIKSGSDSISRKDTKKKKEKDKCKSVVKDTDVESYDGNPLTGIELLVNQLNSVEMVDKTVVNVWGYDNLVELICDIGVGERLLC